VSCEDVREHLAEHLLDSLPEDVEAEVRGHLRGCMACRRELAALDDGMRTFATAAHQVQPPGSLKERVLTVLAEERDQSPNAVRRKAFGPRRIALAAAAVIVLVASVGVAAVQSERAGHYQGLAASYKNFLHALGGRDVRVGTLAATGQQDVQGSVVMYDSDVGQSWILVLVRAPGMSGEAQVVVSSPNRSIELHPLEFGTSGEASSWLVTANDISGFDRVRIVGPAGNVVATGTAKHE
jgi:hypothetical protein